MQDFDFPRILITFAQILPKYAKILPKKIIGNAAASPASTALLVDVYCDKLKGGEVIVQIKLELSEKC